MLNATPATIRKCFVSNTRTPRFINIIQGNRYNIIDENISGEQTPSESRALGEAIPQ
jgi:hypothetical protein